MAKTLFGTGNNDTLQGSSGDDLFYASVGSDRYWGGTGGVDTLQMTGRLSDYAARLNADGSTTVLDMRQGSPDGTMTIRDIDQVGLVDGAVAFNTAIAGMAKLRAGVAGADTSNGGVGDDVFTGSSGNDRIFGGNGGNDVLVLKGQRSDYRLTANADGTQTLLDLRSGSPEGSDVLRNIDAISFADVTTSVTTLLSDGRVNPIKISNGTAAADTLLGSAGDDVLTGGGGNDRVWGGQSGYDIAMYSGKFADYVITDNANGSYTVVDTRSGSNDGTDVVRGVEAFRFADRSISVDGILSGNQSLYTRINGSGGNDTLTGADTNGIFGGHTTDVMVGAGGDDVIRGGYGRDMIFGDALPLLTDGALINAGSGPEARVSLANIATETPQTATVTFLGETAGYQNALGVYQVSADGRIHGVDIVFANASLKGSGGILTGGVSSAQIDLVAGDRIGFFIIPNGYAQAGMASVLTATTGTFSFVDGQGGPGTINNLASLRLVHTADNGQQQTVKSAYGTNVFHTIAGENNILNADGTSHVQGSLTLADGSIKLGFEDLWGGGDRDYDDTMFSFKLNNSESRLVTPGTAAVIGNDDLRGGTDADTLFGGAGNDILDGGAGADVLKGGTGQDAADYSRAPGSVVVDLVSGGVNGEAAGDTYSSIERVIGSRYDDTIRGDAETNELSGRAGNDVLEGRGGNDVLRGDAGADALFGGIGFDTVTYYSSQGGVHVDLTQAVQAGADAEGDRLSSIERVQGSNLAGDWLGGSELADELQGHFGADTLLGRGGNDVLGGGEGSDNLDGGAGNDALQAHAGDDTLMGGGGNDGLWGDAGDDVLSGGAGVDRLNGGLGADQMSGGDGADLFVAAASDTGDVIFDFTQGIDRLDLSAWSGLASFADLTVARVSDQSLMIEFNHGGILSSLTLNNTVGVALTAGDIII